MRPLSARPVLALVIGLIACGPPLPEDKDSDLTDSDGDTADTSDTADTADTSDTADTADTSDTADTDPVLDSDTDTDLSLDTDTDLSFAGDISPLLSSCDGCHINSTSGTLNFSNGASDLVNQTATNADMGVVYVEPGDHLNSLFWRKIDGSQGVLGNNGLQMPRNGPPYLDAATIDAVADWIDQGAKP